MERKKKKRKKKNDKKHTLPCRPSVLKRVTLFLPLLLLSSLSPPPVSRLFTLSFVLPYTPMINQTRIR